MLDTIRTFLTELTSSSEKRSFGEDDYRLAAAALLFHVIAVDGAVSAEEREALSALLQSRFELDAGDAATLVSAAETADKEAVDLYGFTSILKGRLEEAERERIVGMMWTLVYADGNVHEFEDNVIWRVAELLGVSSQARIRLKRSVRDGSSG
jgi:uncharacterized tellurite resistance protein B-like protein